MFRAYDYFKAREAEIGLPVYRVTGISKLEELVRDIRSTKFPCLVVDYGADGVLDIQDRHCNRGYYTFHLIDTMTGSVTDTGRIFSILDEMFIHGEAIIQRMAAQSYDSSMPCYGFDRQSIRYSRIGPIGMQAYGYTFNYNMIRDHE